MKFKSVAKKPRLEEKSRPTVEPLSDKGAPEVPVERRNGGINNREPEHAPEAPVERRNEGINTGETEDAPEAPVGRRNEGINTRGPEDAPEVPADKTNEGTDNREPEDAPEVPVERRNEGIEPEVKGTESSFQRFRNTTHENRFEALQNNKLLVTRAVKVESFSPFQEIHATLVKIFEAMEWTKLASILSTDVSPSCVKDFYSSMALQENELSEGATFTDDCLHVFVGGKERQITKKDWGEFFDLPYYCGATCMVNFSDGEVWLEITGRISKSMDDVQDPVHGIILDFSSHSLFCRSRGFGTWEPYEIWFLHCALRMKRVNVTEIMFKRMMETAQDLSKDVPYSNLITMFCKDKGWWCETYEKDLLGGNSEPINPDALCFMSFVVQDGKLVKKVKETDPDIQQPPFSGMNTQLQSITTQLKSIATQVQSMETRLTNFEKRFSQFQNYMVFKLKELSSAQQHMLGKMSGHQMCGIHGRSSSGSRDSSSQPGPRFSHPSPSMNPPQQSQQQSSQQGPQFSHPSPFMNPPQPLQQQSEQHK